MFPMIPGCLPMQIWEMRIPSDEVMVWLYHGGGVSPVGSKVATVTIDGTSWDLWEGNVGWQVHSFVRTSNTNSQSLNLMDFYNTLISRGLSSSKYLISVESGTEIFTGAGQLDTTAYSVNVGSAGGGSTPTPPFRPIRRHQTRRLIQHIRQRLIRLQQRAVCMLATR